MRPTLQALDAELEHAARLRAAWRLDEAEDAFRALLRFEDLRPRLLTEIAITLAHQGRGGAALAAIEEAERLAPDDATIAQNRLILEKLREPEDPDLLGVANLGADADEVPRAAHRGGLVAQLGGLPDDGARLASRQADARSN